jgi:hypothetical protein
MALRSAVPDDVIAPIVVLRNGVRDSESVGDNQSVAVYE